MLCDIFCSECVKIGVSYIKSHLFLILLSETADELIFCRLL